MKYDVTYCEGNWNVREGGNSYPIDLRKRLLDFSMNTIRFLGTIPEKKEYSVIKYQLSKSATSIGANYEESQSCTTKEFHMRMSVCLKKHEKPITGIG